VTPTELHALLELQKKDLTLLQLKKEAGEIPNRQQAIRDTAAQAEQAHEAALKAVKDCEAAIRQVELDVEAAQEKVNKYKNQQMEAKTNEEYKAFKKEIAMAGEQVTGMEDRELEEMARLETAKAEVEVTKRKVEAARAVVESDLKALDTRLETIRSTFADIKADREEMAVKVDPEIRDLYMGMLTKKQEAVVVAIQQDSCGGCHMKVSPQNLHDAHSGQKWTHCSFCGRILYDPNI
jgi:predicted  nucleic acid-binding Zn-ribbon protein